jgi:hypothetical protein
MLRPAMAAESALEGAGGAAYRRSFQEAIMTTGQKLSIAVQAEEGER